jgi:hypothetical protein
LEISKWHYKFWCLVKDWELKKYFFEIKQIIEFDTFFLRYTSNGNNVYAFVLKYSTETLKISLSAPFPTYYTNVTLLGYNGLINWIGNFDKGGIEIDLSNLDWSKYSNELAIAFKITNLN